MPRTLIPEWISISWVKNSNFLKRFVIVINKHSFVNGEIDILNNHNTTFLIIWHFQTNMIPEHLEAMVVLRK